MSKIQLNFNDQALEKTQHKDCITLSSFMEKNFDAIGTQIVSSNSILYNFETSGQRAISGLKEKFELEISASDKKINMVNQNGTIIYDVTAPEPEQP